LKRMPIRTDWHSRFSFNWLVARIHFRLTFLKVLACKQQ
jgi:hypothetical protein